MPIDRTNILHVIRALDNHDYEHAHHHALVLAQSIGIDIGQHPTPERIAAWNVQISVVQLHPHFSMPNVPRTDAMYQRFSSLILGMIMMLQGLSNGRPIA